VGDIEPVHGVVEMGERAAQQNIGRDNGDEGRRQDIRRAPRTRVQCLP
jgi:hypothetical protein